MSAEEKKLYNREAQRLSRAKKKLLNENENDLTNVLVNDNDLANANVDSDSDSDVINSDIDFSHESSVSVIGTAILNIIKNSPKKRVTRRVVLEQIKSYMGSRFSMPEILDILLVLAHALPQNVKDLVKEKGIEIKSIPKRSKRVTFSDITKSSKHRHKDNLLAMLMRYTEEGSAQAFVQMFSNTEELWCTKFDAMTSWGLNIDAKIISPALRISQAVRNVCSNVSAIDHSNSSDKAENKTAKVALMTEAIKASSIVESAGCVKSLSEQFGTSWRMARKVVGKTNDEKSVAEILNREQKKSVHDTPWPGIVEKFCLTKPICREAPGETVSISYGKRAEKYIRQFSISEMFNFFCLKYPEFSYHLTTFRTLVPKNLVAPSLRDVKQNTCPLHENVNRGLKSFNRFIRKQKKKELTLPSSTLDICLLLICNPDPDDPAENRNPLNWAPDCTKGKCTKCGGKNWFNELLVKVKDLQKENITFSRWVREAGSDGKKKQILKQETCTLGTFLQDVLYKSLITENFPEHLRKAWTQWQITKKPLVVSGPSASHVAIRTREDYQEDVKFLCMSETVSTHRGHGVITMLCYPIVMELFKTDGSQELYGLIFMSNSKNKNYDTVNYFAEAILNYVKSKGYCVQRYDRITDGCSSQFWCYGTMHHLEKMPNKLDVPIVNFHRYERYEGKNMSDALGSLLKRKMRQGALQSRKFGNDADSINQIMDEVDDDCDLDDLVFGNDEEAFQWLKMCMTKDDEQDFSEKFTRVELYWVADEDIPKNLVVEKECRKIPQVKSYNSVTAVKGKKGVFIRDTTCSDCDHCQKGEVLRCTSEKNGTLKNYVIDKTLNLKQLPSPDDDDDSDSESSDEFVYDSAADSSDEELSDEDLQSSSIDDLSQGRYVLFKFTDQKFYVSSIIATINGRVMLKTARKYGVKENKITFVWPTYDDIVDVELSDSYLKALPSPVTDRRGSSLIFNIKVFGNVPLNKVT